MFRGFFNRIKQRKYYGGDYGKSLAKYRSDHPESLAEERERIYQWVRFIEKRKQEQIQGGQAERALSDEDKRVQALHRMWETARAAFMSHPAATESDFRRCWPGIREEILKQHALEELAGNPMLATRLAQDAADSNEIFGTEKPQFASLQLLKTVEDSD